MWLLQPIQLQSSHYYTNSSWHAIEFEQKLFKTKILDAVASGKLASNSVFKEYFRGLYFKMEKSGSSAGNTMLNFKADGKITIKYNEDLLSVGAVTTVTRVKKTIVLDLSGNSVSLQNTNYSIADLLIMLCQI
jgi:hypothetical protein